MRFGESTAEQEAAVQNGGNYMKYLRKGDNTFQIIDEYDKWIWFWEHFNPGGWPFPCTNDRSTCPGCTSSNERMQKALRRAAFNAHNGEYTDVYKVPKTVAEKLKNRYDRLGTITDRPYRITQLQNAEGRYDYDIEAEAPHALDMEQITEHLRDPEEFLVRAWEEAWGDSAKAAETRSKADAAAAEPAAEAPATSAAAKPATTLRVEKTEPEPEPVYSEAELRKMDVFELLTLCSKEGLNNVPNDAKTPNQIVDWMLTQVG